MTSKTKTTILEIPILYGSQTGNSQQAAEDLANTLPSKLSTSQRQITSRPISLDDFLEIELNTTSSDVIMSPLFVIITSSYGVGQAPLGCLKFREVCDYILSNDNNSTTTSTEDLWKGCHYAMLGLGDSKYTTFFLNPTALDGALSKAGAVRVGTLGKADASGEKVNGITQAKVIEDWCVNIIDDLKLVLKEREMKFSNNSSVGDDDDDGNSEEEKEKKCLREMKEKTMKICSEIFEDWEDASEENNTQKKASWNLVLIGLIPVLIAIFVAFFMQQGTSEQMLTKDW